MAEPRGEQIDWNNGDPKLIGEHIHDMIVQTKKFIPAPNEEVSRIKAAFDAVSTTPEGVDLEPGRHFIRAVLGVEPKPTYFIDPTKVMDYAQQEWEDPVKGCAEWIQQVTGMPWPGMPDRPVGGHSSYSLGINILIGTVGRRAEEVVHEDAHSGLPLFANLWEEGFACLAEQLYRIYEGGDPDTNYPYKIHDLGLLTVAALCNERPVLFDKMAAAKRELTREAFGQYVDELLKTEGLDLPTFYSASKIGTAGEYADFPSTLRAFVPENGWGYPCIYTILPIIEQKLTEYEQRTGYSFGHRKHHLLGAMALDDVEVATDEPCPSSSDGMLPHIYDLIRTMQLGSAQS
jgi:hypothetical protein